MHLKQRGCLDFEDLEEEQAAMCEEGLLEEYLETGHISVPSMRKQYF